MQLNEQLRKCRFRQRYVDATKGRHVIWSLFLCQFLK